MTSPLSAAMDVTQLSRTWCETFKMNTETPSEKPHGAFHIDRLYCAGFDQFPDCIQLSQETASKMIRKLAAPTGSHLPLKCQLEHASGNRAEPSSLHQQGTRLKDLQLVCAEIVTPNAFTQSLLTGCHFVTLCPFPRLRRLFWFAPSLNQHTAPLCGFLPQDLHRTSQL